MKVGTDWRLGLEEDGISEAPERTVGVRRVNTGVAEPKAARAEREDTGTNDPN